MMMRNTLRTMIKKNVDAGNAIKRRNLNLKNTKRFVTHSFENSNSNHQIINGIGLASAFGSVTTIVAMLPLDEFKQKDPNNVCYHRHLHPR